MLYFYSQRCGIDCVGTGWKEGTLWRWRVSWIGNCPDAVAYCAHTFRPQTSLSVQTDRLDGFGLGETVIVIDCSGV